MPYQWNYLNIKYNANKNDKIFDGSMKTSETTSKKKNVLFPLNYQDESSM